jgi:hypothetical protein
MEIMLIVGFVFFGLSCVFLGLTWREYRRKQGMTITARTRLRLAAIFLAVGLGLWFLHVLIR